MADLISLNSIKRHYDVGGEIVRALDGVDLIIKKNEYISIMGPSGSGKSTLMNMIGCLDSPSEGIYEFEGELVHEMDDNQLASIRNRKIGFVFQTFNLLPKATALRNVEVPLIYANISRSERVEKAKIGNIDITFYKVFIEKEKLTLSIPLNQQSHLRHISSINQINKAITILKSKPKIKRTMWSRRAQEYEQKINSGKLYQLAEVVKDLNKKTDVIAEQSYSERQLFEKAYERILSEFQIVMELSLEDTKKKLDKALKRNLEIQAPKVEPKPEKPIEISE